jgi:hypothetical protein
MATIKFYYRSTKDRGPLSFKFLHSHKGKNFQYWVKTKVEVSKYYWENYHTKSEIENYDMEHFQLETKSELNKIKKHILKEFTNKPDQTSLSKAWIETEISQYYFNSNDYIPRALTEYIEFYLKVRSDNLKDSTKKKYRVLKNKIIRYEEKRNQTVLIKNIGERFKDDFEKYQKENKYAQNTIHRDIGLIKTYCKHARKYGLETHPQLDFLKVEQEEVDVIYLNDSELDSIREMKNLSNDMQTTKDWLLLSCNLGQRVSDFMEFDFSKTWWEDGFGYMNFIQQKTDKRMTIPLFQEVVNILKRNNNNFPKKMQHTKYNKNLKELCKIAGINKKIPGRVLQKVEGVEGYRRVKGEYEKYNLISSHVGRRSFATNYYGKIKTSYIISITGHTTEKMYRNYLPKSMNYAREIHEQMAMLKKTA